MVSPSEPLLIFQPHILKGLGEEADSVSKYLRPHRVRYKVRTKNGYLFHYGALQVDGRQRTPGVPFQYGRAARPIAEGSSSNPHCPQIGQARFATAKDV